MDTEAILKNIEAKASSEARAEEEKRLAAREECTKLFDRVRKEVCPKVAEYLEIESALTKNHVYSRYAENNWKDKLDSKPKNIDLIYTDEYAENVGIYTRHKLRGIGIETNHGRNDRWYDVFVSPHEISLFSNDRLGGYDAEPNPLSFPKPNAGTKDFKTWSMYLQMLLNGFFTFEQAFQKRLKALGVA